MSEPGNDCPECGQRMSGALCATCGWRQPAVASPVTADERAAPRKCRSCQNAPAAVGYRGRCEDCGRCHGATDKGRCRLVAGVWVGATRAGYCGWHVLVQSNPRADTLEEYERYAAKLRLKKYCCDETHYPASALWDEMRRPTVLPEPTWCGAGDCRYAATVAAS